MRIAQAAFFPAILTILPCLVRADLLTRPEPWIGWCAGFLSIATQPRASYLPTSDFYADHRDRNSARFIIISIYGVGAISIIFFILAPSKSGSLNQFLGLTVGLIMSCTGLALRIFSIRRLGRMFTTRVDILPDHELITDGPFRFVRHPAYLGAILTFSAVPILYGAWPLFPFALGVLWWAYTYRASVEEAALEKQFSQRYEEYRHRTGALVPRPFGR